MATLLAKQQLQQNENIPKHATSHNHKDTGKELSGDEQSAVPFLTSAGEQARATKIPMTGQQSLPSGLFEA